MQDKRRFNDSGQLVVTEPPPKKYEIEPLNKWVLIRKVGQEERIKDGVVIPGGGRSSRGIVVAASVEVNLKAGDTVIYTNFPITLEDLEEVTGDKELQLVRYEEVYARVHECT